MDIREAAIDDYDQLYALWSATPGIGITAADSREAIAAFFVHNPGLNYVCEWDSSIIGSCLCGSDGRRGYLYHTVIAPEHRSRGVGRALVERCLRGLAEQGVDKCHVFVFADNENGNAFWAAGWQKRDDLFVYSHNTH